MLKKIGVSFAVLSLIIVAAILIVPGFLDWNEYKDRIEKTASDYTGRSVKIRGDIALSLLPRAALSVEDVSVANIDGGRAEYMLSLKSLDIKVSFPSVLSVLFGGKAEIEKFILVDPMIALEILPDGRTNWDFSKEHSAQTDFSPSEPSADISFDKFQIVGGQISFEDMARQQKELLRKINANVRLQSLNGPYNIAGSARYKDLDVALVFALGKQRPGKKIPLSLSMNLLDDAITAQLLGGVILSGPDSVLSGKLAFTAQNSGTFFTLRDRLDDLPTTMGTTPLAKGAENISLDMTLEATRHKIQIQDMTLQLDQLTDQGTEQSRGQGQMAIHLDPKISVVGDLALNKLNLDPLLAMLPPAAKNNPEKGSEKEEPETARNMLSDLSGRFDFTLGALKFNRKIVSQIAVNLDATESHLDITRVQARMPGGADFKFTGRLIQQKTPDDAPAPLRLTGDLDLHASNLRGMLDWLKIDVAAVPAGLLAPFSYKSKLQITPDMLQLYAIEGMLDATRFSGGLSYALSTDMAASYGLDLNVQNLNLDSYGFFRADDSASGDLNTAFAVLDDFDARYKVGLSNVTINSLKLKKGRFEGLLLGGNLTMETLALDDLAGLTLTAHGTAQEFSDKPKINLDLKASAPSLAVGFQRFLPPDSGFDLRRLGGFSTQGRLSASPEKIDLDLETSLQKTRISLTGIIRSATLKQFPEIGSIDVTVTAKTPSMIALIDQLALPLQPPAARDDQPVALQGQLKSSSDMMDFSGDLSLDAGKITVSGRRKGTGKTASLDMDFEGSSPDSRAFIRAFGIDFTPAAENIGPLTLKTKLIGNGQNYQFLNLAGMFGPVKLTGDGKITLTPEKPVFDFTLSAGDIPLHDFLPAEKTGTQKNGTKQAAFGQWHKTPMDLSFLSNFDGKAHITAASLRYNNYIFEKPDFDLSLQNSMLTIDNFTGRLFGGDVVLSGAFGGAAVPQLRLDMTLQKAALSPATAAAAGVTPVTGFFDLSSKITGQGASQYALMASLAGAGKITASPGTINGLDIPRLSAQLGNMDQEKDFLKLLAVSLARGQTSYKGATSTISLQAGQIKFSPFDVELDGAKSTITLGANLPGWTIRSTGNLALVDHPNAPPIGVTIAGNISNPDIRYHTSPLKKYVGTKIAASLLKKITGNESGLKDIFVKPTDVSPNPPTPATPAKKTEKPEVEFGKRLLQKLFEKKVPREE